MPIFGGQASRNSVKGVRKGSSTIQLEEKKEEEKKEEEKKKELSKEELKRQRSRIMAFYGPPIVKVFSLIMPFLAAFGFPAFGYLFTRFIFILMQPQKDNFRDQVDLYSLIFLASCVFMGVTRYLTKYFYTVGGENCTYSIRKQLFESIIHK